MKHAQILPKIPPQLPPMLVAIVDIWFRDCDSDVNGHEMKFKDV